jgi:pimeloyl-ACP methyl ester carboxylesterase
MFDYRGQFESSSPATLAKMMPEDHASDIACILDDLGINALEMLIGWSFGVQVALGFALQFPHRVQRLALVCGSPGRTLSSFCCLLGPLYPLNKVVNFLTMSVVNGVQRVFFGDRYDHKHVRPWIPPLLQLAEGLVGNSKYILGLGCWAPSLFYCQRRFAVWAAQYVIDTFSHGESHLRHWQQMAHCLEVDDSVQLLHRIKHPTLLIAGQLDILTPSRGMFVMHKLLPNSRLLVRPYGSHFVVWEYPQRMARNIIDFFFDPPSGGIKRRPSGGRMPLRSESDYAVDESD